MVGRTVGIVGATVTLGAVGGKRILTSDAGHCSGTYMGMSLGTTGATGHALAITSGADE